MEYQGSLEADRDAGKDMEEVGGYEEEYENYD